MLCQFHFKNRNNTATKKSNLKILIIFSDTSMAEQIKDITESETFLKYLQAEQG